MRTLLALGLTILTTAAYAGSPCTDPPLPEHYDTTAVHPIFIHHRLADIPLYCGARTLACADPVLNLIIIADTGDLEAFGLSPRDIKCLVEHEKKHLAGWPGDHSL